MITIPDVYFAFCGGYAAGIWSIIAMVWTLTAMQRRRNRRP